MLVLGLGGAIGAVVQWMELEEAKVGGNKHRIDSNLAACENLGVFFAGLSEQVWLPERRS